MPKKKNIAIVRSIFLDSIMVKYTKHAIHALILHGNLLPYKSPNLGTTIQAIVQPAKYIDPSSPIFTESAPIKIDL